MQMAIRYIKATGLPVTKTIFVALNCFLLGNYVFGQNDLSNQKRFVPDTSINSVLKLLNPASIRIAIGDQKTKMIEDEKAVRVQLTNKRGNQYFILYQLPASNWNTFNEFEIGSIKSHDGSFGLSSFASFVTESGIRLGITIDSLINIKGNGYRKSTNGDSVVLVYRLQENGKSSTPSILRRYNMPEYKAAYFFSKSKLIKFIFGFPNP